MLSSAALSLGSFVALWLMTTPLHAGAITSIDAFVEETGPPFSWVSCDQTSAGAGVQCNLNSPATDNPSSSANSSASASFGNLSVAAGAGSLGEGLWQASAQASASFSSDVIFSETGTITGTWFISYAGGGDEGTPVPDIQIMGTNVSIPFNAGASEAEGGFFVPITFTYSGGPIDVSAALFRERREPGRRERRRFHSIGRFFDRLYDGAGCPRNGNCRAHRNGAVGSGFLRAKNGRI